MDIGRCQTAIYAGDIKCLRGLMAFIHPVRTITQVHVQFDAAVTHPKYPHLERTLGHGWWKFPIKDFAQWS